MTSLEKFLRDTNELCNSMDTDPALEKALKMIEVLIDWEDELTLEVLNKIAEGDCDCGMDHCTAYMVPRALQAHNEPMGESDE